MNITAAQPEDASARLAIVIPAWRARHFATALASLRNQTDRRFRLYIGDDGSPDDLRPIVESATAGLDVVYHRFEENLGGSDLVAHWRRCLALTRDEPWIWLFADDDIADPGCVAAFHRFIDAGAEGATLLRFNLEVIDDEDRVIRRPEPHPAKETAIELLTAMLERKGRFWCAPDHIFSRDAYERTGGFFAFPKAMYSDWATWVKFTAAGDVRTLPDARIRFRNHPQGTSSGRLAANRIPTITGLVAFLEYASSVTRELAPSRIAEHRRLSRALFLYILNVLHAGVADDRALAATCREVARKVPSPYRGELRLYALRLRLRTLPGVRRLALWRYRRRHPAPPPPEQ